MLLTLQICSESKMMRQLSNPVCLRLKPRETEISLEIKPQKRRLLLSVWIPTLRSVQTAVTLWLLKYCLMFLTVGRVQLRLVVPHISADLLQAWKREEVTDEEKKLNLGKCLKHINTKQNETERNGKSKERRRQGDRKKKWGLICFVSEKRTKWWNRK